MKVSLGVREGLPGLRSRGLYLVIERAIAAAKERFGLRIAHFAVSELRIELLVEARDRHALALGMQGLGIRIAKAINRELRHSGRVLGDRYEAVVLRDDAALREAALVLSQGRGGGVRAFSSASWFESLRKRVGAQWSRLRSEAERVEFRARISEEAAFLMEAAPVAAERFLLILQIMNRRTVADPYYLQNWWRRMRPAWPRRPRGPERDDHLKREAWIGHRAFLAMVHPRGRRKKL